MFDQILPQNIDNTYRGHKLALWIFGSIVVLKTIISVNTILNGYSVLSSADGVPLATFPPAAAQTMVSLSAIWAFSHLIMCLLFIVVVLRYRRAVPLMFTLLLVEHLGRRLILYLMPIATTATPPGFYVNVVLIALMIVGLVLSLLHRDREDKRVATNSASTAVNKL